MRKPTDTANSQRTGRHFRLTEKQLQTDALPWVVRPLMSLLVTVGFLCMLPSCATNNLKSADAIARSGGLVSTDDAAGGYHHQLYRRAGGPGAAQLVVFLDGDGQPWVRHGTRVSGDPTPSRALALELAAQTPGAVLYVGRPCYFAAREDARCTPALWTSARYSRIVVDGIAEIVNREVSMLGFRSVILVGFSGGGALAVLAARDIPTAQVVVTISGILDIEAWTRFHHYTPLTDSLNPATEPRLPSRIRQVHLTGGLDENMPEDLDRAYFEHAPDAVIWRYPSFDHGCCWDDAWPSILSNLLTEIQAAPIQAMDIDPPGANHPQP